MIRHLSIGEFGVAPQLFVYVAVKRIAPVPPGGSPPLKDQPLRGRINV
jgi:hypothetical protein